ncbi:MAG: condensation domain-containing protein, partial [Phormidium sp.]
MKGNELKAEGNGSHRINRTEEIIRKLQLLVGNALQIKPAEVNIDTAFLEMGADSLMLLEAVRQIENKYKVKISIRQLFEELKNINSLATYIEKNLSAARKEPELVKAKNKQQPEQLEEITFTELSSKLTREADNSIERIIKQQLEVMSVLMSQQLEVLRDNSSSSNQKKHWESSQLITNEIDFPPKEPLNQITPSKLEPEQPSLPTLGDRLGERKGFFPKNKGKQTPKVEPSHVVVPLSEAQKQLWMLAELGKDSLLAYNQIMTLQLRGSLNVKAMSQAIQKIVERHEGLRTKIREGGEEQEIIPFIAVDCPVWDFSNVKSDRNSNVNLQSVKLAEWFDQENQKPFDLSSGLLLRASILRIEPELHLLVLSTHHIVVDGWSMGVILRELGVIYSAECYGIESHLSSPLQFREFIEWQNQQNSQCQRKADQAYWLERLSKPPVLDLPTDHIRPPLKSYHARRKTLQLDAKVTNSLKRLSQQQGCTLVMTLISVYTTLIHRLTGQDDIIVGVPTSGRSLLGSEEIVGYCAHLLPIRSELKGNPTFEEYLQQMRSTLLSAYEHRDYPFAQLLNQLNLERDNSRSPLISASFNLEPLINLPEMFQLETSVLSPGINYADRDLYLNIIELEGKLKVECDYNTDLFDAETIERWLGHYQTLLSAVVSEPKQKLRELPLLTRIQRHQLLIEWNQTETKYPNNKVIHQLFEEQCLKTPEAVAVLYESKQLTYSELNNRANQLAHYLRSLGVGADVLVGICVERSLEMVVGLLGILKAGGAYVPLDPEYPAERLNFMLEDSQIGVLLTQQRLVDKLSITTAQKICLDTDWSEISQWSQENLNTNVQPENLAYIIYTSGSTGQPKGVMLCHRNICNHTFWMQAAFP